MRGTRLDPFGRLEVRRVERQLITEYRDALTRALEIPRADRTALLELAQLPDIVRGYEDIKLANVAAYRRRQEELMDAIEHTDSDRTLVVHL